MTAADMIDAVVADFVAPLMTERGFKKTARNWHRDLGTVVLVVNLQGSSWNSSDRARFTLNLGLWFPCADEIAGKVQQKNRRPPEYMCTLRERIGRLMPEDSDVWWELNTLDDAVRVGPAVTLALSRFGLPWLEDLSEPLDAFEFLRQRAYRGHSPVSAFALALSVEREDLALTAYRDWRSQVGRLEEDPIVEWATERGLA